MSVHVEKEEVWSVVLSRDIGCFACLKAVGKAVLGLLGIPLQEVVRGQAHHRLELEGPLQTRAANRVF